MKPRPADADLPGEVWIPIKGFEGDYSVSNMGRVKRTSQVNNGPSYAGKVLTCPPNREGYRALTLCVTKHRHTARVHVLVMRAFVGPRPPGATINHLDGDKLNPRLDNLEYCTLQANALHARRTLGKCVGSLNGASKLHESDIPAIRARLAAGEFQRVIARDYGVSQVTISHIANGLVWGRVK